MLAKSLENWRKNLICVMMYCNELYTPHSVLIIFNSFQTVSGQI
jgi:hypothetical protein